MEQFHKVLEFVKEPFRLMCIVAICLGLRASEFVGLQWSDFDWEKPHVAIQRGVVIGRVDEVKTRHSKRAIPLDPALASLLLSYRREAVPSQWVFPSSRTGRPWWPWVIQRTHLAPAGIKAGLGRIGWHTFRHSFSSWGKQVLKLEEIKELLRHENLKTTSELYGGLSLAAKRDAQQRLVEFVKTSAAADQEECFASMQPATDAVQ